ncbi:MAG: hypothetical protein ACO2PM_05130 [Pyrobaculum sp.]
MSMLGNPFQPFLRFNMDEPIVEKVIHCRRLISTLLEIQLSVVSFSPFLNGEFQPFLRFNRSQGPD